MKKQKKELTKKRKSSIKKKVELKNDSTKKQLTKEKKQLNKTITPKKDLIKKNKKKIILVEPKTDSTKLSYKKKALAFLELIRLNNCLMALIAILVGYAISRGANTQIALIASLSGFLICAGGQAINDFFDSKIDEGTNRPIPTKRISKGEALWFSINLFILGNLLALTINPLSSLIAIIFTILLVAYPLFLNKVKYLGNFLVAGGTAVTFVFGAAATGGVLDIVIILALTAFFANMGREVTKDIEDLEKDKNTKRTLPMIIGVTKTKLFIITYYLIAIVLGLRAFTLFSLNNHYLAFILAASIIFVRAIILLHQNKFAKSQKESKTAMIFAIIGFVLILL